MNFKSIVCSLLIANTYICPASFAKASVGTNATPNEIKSDSVSRNAAVKQSGEPASTDNKESLPKITLTEEIDVAPAKVWEAIKQRRQSDSQRRKMLSYNGKTAVIKEVFEAMPVLGDTFCTYEEDEILPLRRLEYKLLNSNHLHQFAGTWLLSAGPKPNSTIVSLTSTIDPDIRFPFWRRIATHALMNNLEHTLKEVSELATKECSPESVETKRN
jgi:hypothetical protein